MKTKGNGQAKWIKRLTARFPELFCDISVWGIVCEAGWEDLITRLCERLVTLDLPDLRVVQVKEKFGTLRFYVVGGNDEVSAMIRQSEEESSETCEWCGAQGDLRKSERGYLLTLCETCFEKWVSNGWVMAPPS